MDVNADLDLVKSDLDQRINRTNSRRQRDKRKAAFGVRPVNWRVISLGLVQADQRVSCSQERLQTHSAERSR